MHYGDAVTSNTAATLIAHLCDDGSRLPVYWCSLYSPCLGIFLPTFSRGEIPGVLSVGGKQPSDGSPWWLFRTLEKTTRRGTGFDPAAVDAIRAEWAPVQNDLIGSAYGIAIEANDLIRNGTPARANEVVTEYMASNTDLMLRTVKGMLSRLAPATLAPTR
jgi:dipeptidase